MIGWLLGISILIGCWKKTDVFRSFSQGAKEGLQNAIQILPALAVTLTAIRVFESSGIMEECIRLLSPLASVLGLPQGVMPLLLLRPLSGSASLSMLGDILTQYGPDSRTGLVASAMMGSGETILYTCAVYLSAAGISKSRYIIPVALAGWMAGCIMAGLFFPESFA